jgi:hypothetical protein
MTWGIGTYGTGGWGIDLSLNATAARATSERTVLVTLSTPPLAKSPVGDGDALDPATWFVRRGSFSFHPLAVRQVDAATFEIFTLLKFDPFLFNLEVGSDFLIDASGNVAPPFAISFAGCKFVPPAESGDRVVDYASPFLQGGLAVASSGDLDAESGVSLLRKLVVRRLTTARGGFFHLPNYGIGLDLKAPLPLADLTALRVEVERQISQEPDLTDVRSRLILGADGVLTVEVQATLERTGEQVSVAVTATPQGVQL